MTREFFRRRFLKGIGVATAAASFPDVLRVVASQPAQENVARPRAIVFWETDFPQIEGCSIDRNVLQTALERFDVRYLSEHELIAQLKPDRCGLLITPYGSAFSKRAWPAILRYLQAGGNRAPRDKRNALGEHPCRQNNVRVAGPTKREADRLDRAAIGVAPVVNLCGGRETQDNILRYSLLRCAPQFLMPANRS